MTKQKHSKNATSLVKKSIENFHCCCHDNIFRVSTAKKVMDFDFADFKNEERIIHCMLIAIAILKKHLNKQILLFDDPEEKVGEKGRMVKA